MADTQLNSALQVQKWERNFFTEYVRENEFKPYMGTSNSALVVMKEDALKDAGESINIPLIEKLNQAMVTGNDTLSYNEEAMNQYNHRVNIDLRRAGVAISSRDQKFTVINLLDAARERLMVRAMDDLRSRVIEQLHSISGTVYSSATEAAKDAWSVSNSDRLLFGSVISNYSGDHSVDLAKVDSTNDKLTAAVVSKLRRIAREADPLISPFRIASGGRQEHYVLFCGTRPFRDLKADSTFSQAQREALARGMDHEIFQGPGTLMYDGVIIVEVPEIDVLSGVGASSIDVAPVFLCGAQALGYAIGQRTRATQEVRDHGRIKAVGIETIDGLEKLIYNSKDHGIVTGYVSGVADA